MHPSMFFSGPAPKRSGNPWRQRVISATMLLASVLIALARAQSTQYPKPTDLPNPYRLVEGWPHLPASLNGGHWGEVIRVHVDPKSNVWVFHRCFAVVPAGSASCLGRGDA